METVTERLLHVEGKQKACVDIDKAMAVKYKRKGTARCHCCKQRDTSREIVQNVSRLDRSPKQNQ